MNLLPFSAPTRTVAPWQQSLQSAFAKPADLLRFLGLPESTPGLGLDAVRDFPLRVPLGFAERMARGDADDPLFRQIWPAPAELDVVEGFGDDAVGDLAKLKNSGLIHKYHGRALVITTGACAVNCRYCFRRHFPYSEQRASKNQWQELLAEIAADPSLTEIILSGGDPLSLTDEKLAELVEGLDRIPHLKRLRVHTRTPIVLPERVDANLIEWLTTTRLRTVMVVHANHANELDANVAAAMKRLRKHGIPLLNQSVLLRGVNDSLDALIALSERLFEVGVLPYYLHLLDRVQGAAHFEVDEAKARGLARELAGHLPGYLVPRLAREVPGKPSKTWIQ